jgi:hypothetical protein
MTPKRQPNWMHDPSYQIRPGPMSSGRRVTIYFPIDLTNEVKQEGARQGLTRTELIHKAWEIARDRVRSIQTPPKDAREEARQLMAASKESDS